MSKWGWRNQHCPLGRKYAHGCMCILILTNGLLTLCTYSMRERCYLPEEDGCGTEHNFLCQVLTRTKKNNPHACTDALAYVQGLGPWTQKNQSDSSVGDSRESGSSEEHTSLPLHKRTLSRSQSVFLQNPVTDPDYSLVRRVLSLIPIFVFCQLQQKHVS